MKRRVGLGCLVTLLLMGCATMSAQAAPAVPKQAWDAYRASFLDPSGRIVDTGNGGISHSEGQGYGLVLAVLAEDEANFDRIWTFTRTELLLRNDGLAAWQWLPDKKPHVQDLNNATDGDILIAYALGLAAERWSRPDLTEAGEKLAKAIGSKLVFANQGRELLRPAVQGFGKNERPDGPVVNLSYWVFDAFPVLERLAPSFGWAAVDAGGRSVLRDVMSSTPLPPDWLSVGRSARPAKGFPAEFGYNALRLPLYLLRAGDADSDLAQTMASAMTAPDGSVRLVEVLKDKTVTTLPDPGYRAIPAAIACVAGGKPLSSDNKTFTPTLYYPSTLHLLALAALHDRHPECLR